MLWNFVDLLTFESNELQFVLHMHEDDLRRDANNSRWMNECLLAVTIADDCVRICALLMKSSLILNVKRRTRRNHIKATEWEKSVRMRGTKKRRRKKKL